MALQLLFYPGCAAWPAFGLAPALPPGPGAGAGHIEYFFGQYIDDADREDWRFAPLNTPEVEGVAPAWFGLAECDPLVDDGVQYADKLRAAGVAVDLEIYRGVTHEFIKWAARSRKPAGARPRGCGPRTGMAMKREDFRFFHRLRVRWAEVDMQKIVFNAHYLMYFDTAVADYWRALAMPYEEGMRQLQGDLYVKKATVEFHASARMDDRLDIAVKCARIGNSSMQFLGAIFRGEELLITCELVYVFADPATQTSRPVPPCCARCSPATSRGSHMLQVKTGSWAELGADAAASAPRCS